MPLLGTPFTKEKHVPIKPSDRDSHTKQYTYHATVQAECPAKEPSVQDTLNKPPYQDETTRASVRWFAHPPT